MLQYALNARSDFFPFPSAAMSEKATSKITKQSSRGPSSLPVPPPPPDGSDSEDSLDYDLPDNPITRRGPVGVSQTMPRQVPQRQESHSVHQAIITSSSPRDTFSECVCVCARVCMCINGFCCVQLYRLRVGYRDLHCHLPVNYQTMRMI